MNDMIKLGALMTKREIARAGTDYANKILDLGETNPLDAVIQLRALRDAVDRALDLLQDAAIDEAEMYGRDDSERFGVKFQVRNARTYYEFDHDTKWAEIKAAEQELAEQRKKREKFLCSLEDAVVDPETGEFVEPARIKSVAKTSLALTYPKE